MNQHSPKVLAEAIKQRRTKADRHNEETRLFDTAPDSAYVRLYVVCKLFACSPATVWRRVLDGKIPQPKRFGPRHTAWNVGQLRQALSL